MIEGGNGRSRACSFLAPSSRHVLYAGQICGLHPYDEQERRNGTIERMQVFGGPGKASIRSREKVCVETPVPIPSPADTPRARITSPTLADRETVVISSSP